MYENETDKKTVAFLADWKNRAGKQQRKYLILSGAAFLVAIILCFVLFIWYQSMNYERIVNQNMNYVQDSAISEANEIEHEFENARTLISNLARQYATLYKLDESISVEDRLTFLSDKTIFDRIAFISPDGMDISLEGIADVSDRVYFQDAISGNSGWELIQKSRITGKSMVVFYSPVKVDNEIIGVIVGFYEKDKLEELFTYQLFNYNPNTYLLLGDGTLVANSMHVPAGGNMLDELSKKNFVGENDFEAIKTAINDSGRTVITFSFVENGSTTVGVLIQFLSDDWMMLSLLPNDITSGMVERANKSGAMMLTAIILVFGILTVVLIFFFKQQRDRLKHEISMATESLKSTIREEEKQLAIIQSLGNTYSSIYYLDLTDSTYHRIKDDVNKEITDVIVEDGAISTGFGKYISEFVAPEYQDAMTKFIDADTLKERLINGEELILEYQRSDGKWRRSIIVKSQQKDSDLVSAIFAVQQIDKEKEKELRTKKALEEAYEAATLASNAKTTFLSNMSHDIRTPMNAIVGMTAIAGANMDNPEKVADCLKKITYSSKHLLGLINEVLDMSKIESGKVDLFEEEFDLSELISNMIMINQPLINEKNHNLIVKINNVQHEDVVGDRTRLMQVLNNFLSNAIKYTPENGTIEIYVSEKDTNKASVGWYEVIFKDNGIGMSEDFVKNIFEPFSRAKDDRVSGIQGTGLGMPIAKNIINMMNGNITVESKVNEGSTFTVSFTLKLQQNEAVHYEEFIDLPVLVADDDKDACESTCQILDELSMKSEWVLSGREAIDKVVMHHNENDDYYAVILDWKMPDMNGVETAREIRKYIGDEVPIIVISAYDWTDIEHEAREAGVNGFLSKPLFKSRIVNLFGELVGVHKKENTNIKKELSEFDFSGRRALLVEDNEINREMASEFLSMVGLETECAENGKLGVEKFSESAPGYYDIIFMDIQMPVMDGYEATTAIRALDREDAHTIPIIAMTANAFAADVRHAFDSGMNGHISKPIDMNKVVKMLEEKLPEKQEEKG